MENKDYIKNIEGAERRYFVSEVRSSTAEGKTSVVEGYAAKFNSVTTIGTYYPYEEVIDIGAFDDVLADDIRCLFNHDPNYILARSKDGNGTLKVEIDNIGFKYSYDSPKRSYADDLLDAIDKGDVSQSSFAFKIKEQKWTYGDPEKGTLDKRTILKFEKLFDVSPVTYPAYTDTEVAKRSMEESRKNDNIPPENETRGENNKELSAFEAQILINQNLE
jgi:HK97 family phage prohead protease